MTKIEAKSVYDCYGKLVTALLPPYYGIRHLCRNAVKMATLAVRASEEWGVNELMDVSVMGWRMMSSIHL